MTRAIGIDFGHHSIKVAELELSSKTPQILGLYEVKAREDQDLVSALREFFAQSQLKSDRLGVGLNAKNVLVKRMQFPFKDQKRVSMAVEGEWMDALPFDLDEYTVETRHVARQDKLHVFLSGLCPEKNIAEVNQLCEEAWVQPNAVFLDAETLGLLALHQNLPQSQEQAAYAVLDFGFEVTKIAVLRGSHVPADKKTRHKVSSIAPEILELRHIDKGTQEWIDWIAHKRRVSSEEALQWLMHRAEIQNAAEGDESSIREDLSDDIKSALRPIIVEIYQTLQHSKLHSGYEAETVYITGNMCHIQGLKEFLSHELKVDVQAWPLFTGFKAHEALCSPSHQKSFASALSYAYAFSFKNSSPFLNFRRNTHPKRRILTETFQQLLGPELKPSFALVGLTLIFCWLYSLGGSFLIAMQQTEIEKDLSGEFRRLDTTTGERASRFVGEPQRARDIFF
jgi:Tfp pilus assembly PilM family ATPase